MEHIGGEPLLPMDGTPRSVPFALRIVREIATALNYAHSKGFVHRDVKPDNILLREDGSSALTDFGIARASDSATHMTRTGTVIGTPHYMSPEQARGRQLDGRADLYSLGIVLYELLVGRVPFHAEDSLAVGIMHITQPIPVLPENFAALQPLLSRMLAKQPEDRFQNGAVLADAIEQLEFAIAQGEMPELLSPRDGGEAAIGRYQYADARHAEDAAAARIAPARRTEHRPHGRYRRIAVAAVACAECSFIAHAVGTRDRRHHPHRRRVGRVLLPESPALAFAEHRTQQFDRARRQGARRRQAGRQRRTTAHANCSRRRGPSIPTTIRRGKV